MDQARFYETLVRLYLRLNGYFQTGFISHSNKKGNNATEIDLLAIRFPFHKQPEREVGFSPALSIPVNCIDIIYAEVKSKAVEFNKSIKPGNKNSDRNWRQILNWIGLLNEEEIENVIPKLQNEVELNVSSFKGIKVENRFGTIAIRPIIFSIESTDLNSISARSINCSHLIEFIWDCLCLLIKRDDCSTKYPLTNWGAEFEQIVKFFKDRNDSKIGKPSLEELKAEFIQQ